MHNKLHYWILFVSTNEATKEVIWFRWLLSNIGISQDKPTMFYSDNQNAIWLVKNLEYHKQTKHIDTKYSLICEKWETKQIELSYVHTMTKLVICWLNHCPKISIKVYEAIWGWLLQTFIYLHEWVGEMSYMPIEQMIHMTYEWEYWVHTKKFVCLWIILLALREMVTRYVLDCFVLLVYVPLFKFFPHYV